MKIPCKKYPYFILLIAIFAQFNAIASHIIGNQFTYQLIDSSSGSYHYRVTLNLYIDGLNGAPSAIAQDNPAFFSIYNGAGSYFLIDTMVYSDSMVTVPADYSIPCGHIASPPYLTLKRTFTKDYTLPANATGYYIVYQRCCMNAALSNVNDPGNVGATYICHIPPTDTATYNNSAVFTNEPPQILALDNPVYFDCSATDADGDSLSYGLNAPLNCCDGSGSNPKPVPAPPPYDSIIYTIPFSGAFPMPCSVPLQIDPVTGLLTGTPIVVGRYLISVYCNEYRHGVLINTSTRSFEFTVVPGTVSTYRPFAGDDTVIMVGDSIQFEASGAISYEWSPATYLSTTVTNTPVGHFPDPGVFTYILHGVSDSGCIGNDTIEVSVLASSEMAVPNGFTPNGDGVNDFLKPIPILNCTMKSFKVYNRNGSLLFSAGNINEGWDGTYHGVKQEMGAYIWELIYEDNTGNTKKMSGNVTLLR